MKSQLPLKGPLAWFARNHVAANLLMVALMALGLALALTSKVNVFPDIDPRTISVSVVYPGATPEEVEEGISRRVEEAVAGIQGIKRVRSTSSEGRGSVSLELEDDADKSKVLDDVKSAVDGIQNFPPQDAETPIVQDATQLRKVLTVALWGDASERTLRELAFRLRDDIASLDGISIVSVEGVRDYEIGIEVSERSLRTFGLTFAEVAQAVRQYSVNLPAGSIRTDQGEILLRTSAQAYDGLDFARLIVRTQPDGMVIRLGDVAEIVDSFTDVDTASTFNGQPAAYVAVRSVGKQQVLDIETKVKAFAETWPTPEGVQASIWGNRADGLRGRIDLLLRNGLMGLVLVFFVLVLFLDLRLAFWTTMGIPISFLGAFLFIAAAGASIDMISLFAFILVLGIVVDDAIVVGENIFAKREEGLVDEEAAIAGLREVVSPGFDGRLHHHLGLLAAVLLRRIHRRHPLGGAGGGHQRVVVVADRVLFDFARAPVRRRYSTAAGALGLDPRPLAGGPAPLGGSLLPALPTGRHALPLRHHRRRDRFGDVDRGGDSRGPCSDGLLPQHRVGRNHRPAGDGWRFLRGSDQASARPDGCDGRRGSSGTRCEPARGRRVPFPERGGHLGRSAIRPRRRTQCFQWCHGFGGSRGGH